MKPKIMLFGLVAITLGMLLVACGETPTGGAQDANTTATAAPNTGSAGQLITSATGQPTLTSAAQPVLSATPVSIDTPIPPAPPKPQPTLIPITQPDPTLSIPVYTPVIRFSATSVEVGDTLTVSGSGFPARIKLDILLSVPDAGLFGPYSNPVVDAKGNFTSEVKLASYPDGKPLPQGQIVIKVSTTDGKYGASAPVTLLAPVPVYRPVLEVTPQNRIKLGGELTLNGSGYPPHTELRVFGGAQSPSEQYGYATTDSQGRFNLTFRLPLTGIYPGVYLIFAESEDSKYWAKAILDIYAA